MRADYGASSLRSAPRRRRSQTAPVLHTSFCRRAQIEAGVKELVAADKAQRSGRAASCIALLLVLIVVFLIITIVRRA